MAILNGRRDSIRQWAHWLFEIGIWWKGLDGVLEFVGGFILYFESTEKVSQWLLFLTQHEWANDPQNHIAQFLLNLSEHLSQHQQMVGAVYLWGHGAIKMGLVGGLLTGKRAVFPWAMAFLGVFCLYQFIQFWRTGSVGYLVVTLLDVVVIGLVFFEYQRIKRNMNHQGHQESH